MTLAARLTRCPDPYEQDRADEALAAVPGMDAPLAALVAGTAGCSPYLKGLIEKEAAWLPSALDAPESAIAAEFAALRALAPEENPATPLRQAKRRVALMTALADLGGAWPLEAVTGTLTGLGDLAMDIALRHTIAAEIRRNKLPGGAANGPFAGLTALAMGKMGAYELNYSSDIDLIVLFDESLHAPDDYHEVRASLIRATRRACALLSDVTAEGYVFRTDLRLRPDPSVTPVCMSMEAAERYYESLGRTWERAAYVKARAAAGDLEAGRRFLTALKPFVWRRHLDFAAIQDAHDMRLRIREAKGLHGPVTLPGHDMKLGRGGIREIEFFTQTRQIIAGGRDPDLRLRATVPALAQLAAKGWVPDEVTATLTGHYRFHREVEHRVQMLRDAQTHRLPSSPEGMDRLAAFMGRDRAGLEAELTERLTETHSLTEGFFAGTRASAEAPPPAPEGIDEAVMERWLSYPALRSDRAAAIFGRLRPKLMARLAQAGKPAQALDALDHFFRGLPAGVQVFSLFEANPHLIGLLVDVATISPRLAVHLSRNPAVFDAVIGGDFFADWPGTEALQELLADVIAREGDYEARLDAARRWMKEWHFRIGVHHLRGLISARESGAQYASLAEAVLRVLWPEVCSHFATRHGPPPGRGATVLAMGSLGAGRLHAGSDLDLIVIYDAEGAESSEGRRPLATRAYYARLTQALVTALTAQMSEGRLYEVDMRLRPSGNQGPVATSWPSFRDYQSNEAWTWEHLALTRARPVAGAEGLGRDVAGFCAGLLRAPQDRAKVLADTAGMRARIRAAKPPASVWDTKAGPGRLQDIELFSQAGSLLGGRGSGTVAEGLADCAAAGLCDAGQAARLDEGYELMWQIRAFDRLIGDKPPDPETLGEDARGFLLERTGAEDLSGLAARLQTVQHEAARIISEGLGDVQDS